MMDLQSTKLKHKIEDYSRFLITLLILSIYFYLGMIINTFVEPSDKGLLLIILLVSSTSIAGFIAYRIAKWQKQLNEMVEQ